VERKESEGGEQWLGCRVELLASIKKSQTTESPILRVSVTFSEFRFFHEELSAHMLLVFHEESSFQIRKKCSPYLRPSLLVRLFISSPQGCFSFVVLETQMLLLE